MLQRFVRASFRQQARALQEWKTEISDDYLERRQLALEAVVVARVERRGGGEVSQKFYFRQRSFRIAPSSAIRYTLHGQRRLVQHCANAGSRAWQLHFETLEPAVRWS